MSAISTSNVRRARQHHGGFDAVIGTVLHPLQTMLRHYTWVHTILGIIGNVCFVVGSILFLFESLKTAGIALFILGSTGMLIGSIGRAVLTWEDGSD